ncbi:MFS transporter [Gayadomonas joobiniege]|uniref:MFS transporter n=1 Tax=Gayadomonas joobiniege TaxID=1234606 RepID=UPI000371B69E
MRQLNTPVASTNFAIFMIAIGTFILGLTEFSSMPLLPLIAQSYQVTPAIAGQVISAYALGVVVGAPLLMLMTNKIKRRNALIIFTLLMCIGNGLSALAGSITELSIYRFISGLPHGAYFGTGLLLAAELAPKHKRASNMAKIFFGLTIATIVGVPSATLVGQYLGWQTIMAAASVLSVLTSLLIYLFVPARAIENVDKFSDQINVLGNKLVWTILAIVIVGFGGVFCIYTYLADTILNVTQTSAESISVAMVMFGVGMTVGNWICGQLADRHPIYTTGGALACSIIFAVIYVYSAYNIWLLYITVFLLGGSVGIAAVIQSMLMDVAPQAHSMIGALVQCSFNTANAIGPWVGGMALSAGAGFNQTGYVAAALFAGGLFMWFCSYLQMRKPTILAEQ